MARSPDDQERNRFSARAARYARVGTNVGGGRGEIRREPAVRPVARPRQRTPPSSTAALGGLKGPIMKVAQLMATIPDLLPPEYAEELQKLQSDAPPMGWAFVKRRMMAELGAGWQEKFRRIRAPAGRRRLARPGASRARARRQAARRQAAVSRHAVGRGSRPAAARLAVRDPPPHGPGDRHQRDRQGDRRARARGARLSARGEARRALSRDARAASPLVRVPAVWPKLSTGRLLTLDWLDGTKLLAHKGAPLAAPQSDRHRDVHRLVAAVQPLRRDPRRSASRQLHGVRAGRGACRHQPARLWLHPHLPAEVRRRRGRSLQRPAATSDADLVVHAYETWGFKGLSRETIDILNIWAKFIYGPLLDDRERTIADGVKPSEYGRREAFRVHQGLKKQGRVRVPREFVFMDRAAIGLGAVFLHLDAQAQLLPAVQRGDREVLARRGRQAAGRGACQGRARPRPSAA